jgi:hypothetical protein
MNTKHEEEGHLFLQQDSWILPWNNMPRILMYIA